MTTFRLADSMPVERRVEWQRLLRVDDEVKRRARIEAYLDAGHGSCHLRQPGVARVTEAAILFFDGARYRLLGRNGTFWQPDYFDRVVRNAEHFGRARAYIDENPVKAGLVQRAPDWPFGSARFALG